MGNLVGVVIVNWNGLAFLRQCLPAVMAQTVPDVEVVVVDNASTDGSAAWLADHYPQVKVLVNSTNLGFAEANNQGIGATQNKYVAILNNDTVPEREWLAGLLAVGESAPDVGMVASQVSFMYDPGRLDSAGIEVDVLGMAWNRHLGDAVDQAATDPVEVFGPSGSAALLRREMLDRIGAFDTRYFAYYEDVDLAWRAQRAGWRCLYAPVARVAHVHSATARRMPGLKAYRLGLNKWRTLFKHYPFARLAPWVPLLVLVDTLAWFLPLIFYRDASALRGRRQAWQERGEYWAERHAYGGDPWHTANLLRCPDVSRLFARLPGSVGRYRG